MISKTQQDQIQDISLDLNTTKFIQKQYRHGQWTQKQNLKHYLFVFHHKMKFQSDSMRKSFRVFKMMSDYIITRNPSQCRSHHIKVLGAEKNVQNTLNLYIKDNPTFWNQYKKVRKNLQYLDDYHFCQDYTYDRKKLKIDNRIKESDRQCVKVQQQQGLQIQAQQKNMFPVYPKYNYGQMMNPVIYKQCHELFFRWMSKLQYLMKAQSQ